MQPAPRRSLRLSLLLALLVGLSVASSLPAPAKADCTAAWSVVTSPNGSGDDNELGDVEVISANDIWAVGNTGTGANPLSTLTEHWNGTSWSVVPSPNGALAVNYLTSVSAVSSTDVWAVGYTFNGSVSNSQSRTLTLHWNGAAWSVVPSPNTSNPENQLLGVVAIAANDVWAVGHWYDYSVFRTLIMHWNGATWSIVPSPNPGASANFLYSVEAVAAHDVWAVGTQQDTLEQTLAIHWNGATWTVADTPQIGPFGNNMLEVSAVSANDIWAVGFHLEVFGFDQPYQTSAFHYDGTSWAAVPPLNVNQEPNYLFDVVALAANDVWAVGFYDTGTALKTMIQHWDGTGWSFIPSPSPGDHADELIAIDAASATDLWAVGRTAGTFFGAGTLVEHFGPACPTNTPGPTVTATPTRTPTATPNGATPTPRRTATVTPTPPAAAMHVADIAPSFSARLGSFQVRAVITIQNTGNVAVPAASVTVNITQPNGAVVTQTRTTNTNGSATFTITSSQTGTYTFTVTNVTKTGLAYNAAANVETSDSISVQ